MFDSLQNTKKQKAIKTPKIMGILNVTPDSFSDGGQFYQYDKALAHVKKMIDEGADIIDIGGESTRPGATSVSEEVELQRVIPIIEALRKFSDITISIDSSKANVMQHAVNAGASMINDVFALRQKNALSVASRLDVPVCLVHMQGTPKTMQNTAKYDNVIDEVKSFLRKRVFECQNHGININNIILDPGFGFGKTVEQNFLLLSHLEEFTAFSSKVLVGISRKSMLGAVTDSKIDNGKIDNRLPASLSAAVIAALKGADILRVHDVLETHQALAIVRDLSITQVTSKNG